MVGFLHRQKSMKEVYKMKDKKILRGDMFYANLGRGIGS